MRNFSMKKFGTPIRAAPGVASETVGLSSVGEPSALRVGLERSTRFLACLVAFSSVPVSDSAFGRSAPSPPPVLRSRVPPPLPLSRLGAAGVGAAPLPDPSSPGCWFAGLGSFAGAGAAGAGGGVGTAVGRGVGVATGPRSVIDCTGAGRPGIWIDSTAVPGGTSMVIVSVWPVTSVIETRCRSAAAGTTSMPNRAAAAANAMTSFRRLMWVVRVPSPAVSARFRPRAPLPS